MIPTKDIIGKKFGRLTAVEIEGKYPSGRAKWKLICECGNIVTAPFNNLSRGAIKSCGCLKRQTSFDVKWKGIGNLGLDHFNSIVRNSKSRNIPFNITHEFASKLFDEQKGRCALTGKVITLSTNKKKNRPTASLDRIDNNLGYENNNVQWVHRDINIAKNIVSNEDFIAICDDVASYNKEDRKRPIIAVSGGFDPVHIGHIRMFNAANQIGDVIAIVNSDKFIVRKKGKEFMPFKERIEVIENFKSVSSVVACVDNDMTVCKTLEMIKPDYFANGGDRNIGNIPEKDVCDRLGIKMLFNIGGDKIQSSSWLLQ